MKHVLTTLISCLVLLSTTLSTPALAEVKDEVAQSDVSVVQDTLTVAACGVQSVLDGAKTQITELFSTSEQVALDENESAPASVRASSQDTISAGVVSSNLAGVEWRDGYKTCTLKTGLSVDGQALRSEIASHKTTLTTFEAEDRTSLTGSAANLFSDCMSLAIVDLAQTFDTGAVTDMSSMFWGCRALTSLKLPDAFDTGAVKSMDSMFSYCSSLTSLTLSDAFKTSTVTSMGSMFSYCSSLTFLTLSDAFNTSAVKSMDGMFSGCSGLTSLTLSDAFNTSAVTNMQSMFTNCSDLASLALPNAFNTSKVTNMGHMFYNCSGLTSLKLPKDFNTSKVTDMSYMFYNCSGLTSLTLSDAFKTSAVKSMDGMFQNCSRLTSLTLSDAFNTSAVTNMQSMFSNCSNLASLNLPKDFNINKVTDMHNMFKNCSGLISLAFPDAFDPKAAQDMRSMFENCAQLERINMPTSSSENLTNCSLIFANCNSLKELNLGNFVPPAGQGSLGMFAACDIETGDILGSIPNIEKITMSGACILAPGEMTMSKASGTFFDYKEPLSWNAYYLGNAAEGQPSDSSTQGNLSAEPTAVLTGFDEFKAYQETHPGLTTYIFDEQPTPPGPTPDPTPEPTSDVMPASDTDVLPLTGDMSVALRNSLFVVLLGVLTLFVAGSSLSRKRSL